MVIETITLNGCPLMILPLEGTIVICPAMILLLSKHDVYWEFKIKFMFKETTKRYI
ncbi:protein of unknown function [Xenorhabdus poinarii G6]|uniref:Uncharacterized protein n=1 Tax=Xenorhabdus poinarii G6 TaxID=1354304 RepID=A0A068R1C8_9GAMM|nr:protein of unknown function [Xenorhabdus poinarii G6]